MDTPSPNLDSTIGAALVGALISSTLFGVVIVQTYTYYNRFPNDRATFKYLVNVIWICELVHCALICESAYTMLVKHYGNLKALTAIPPTLNVAVGLTGTIESLVQAFFAYRIFVVSRTIFIPAVCWILSAVRCALTFTTMAVSIRSASVVQLIGNFRWLIGTVLGVGTVVDLTLSTTLIYYLVHRKPDGNQSTSPPPPWIDKIIAWTVQSGFLATFTGIVMLVTFFASSDSYIWLAIFSFMSRIFSISFLASLNGRTILRENAFQLQKSPRSTNTIVLPSMSSTISDLKNPKQNAESFDTSVASPPDTQTHYIDKESEKPVKSLSVGL